MNSSPLSEILRLGKQLGLEKLFSVSPRAAGFFYSDPEVEQLYEIKKASSPLPSVDPEKASILYFVNRPWSEHRAFEGFTGRALRMRGHRVEVVCADRLPQPIIASGHLGEIGNGSLPWTYDATEKKLSLQAANYIRAVMKEYELPIASLSGWVDLEEKQRISDRIRKYSGDWSEFEYRGHPVGEWCETSVAWQLTGETIDESLPHVQWLYQRSVYAASITAAAFEHGLSVTAPDVLVAFNGVFAPERAAFEVARHHETRVVTHEGGHHQGSHVLAHNGPANYFRCDPEWTIRRGNPLSEDEKLEIRTYLQRRQGADSDGGRVDYWPSVTDDCKAISSQLNLDLEKKTLVLFPNVIWDSAVLQRDVAFEGLLDWIFYTISLIDEISNAQLVIRSHPAEVRLGRTTDERIEKRVKEELSTLPSNVQIVPPESDLSSYRLMDMSDAVLVYTSTTGLEATLRRKPVLVAGGTHYRGKGFTIDVETKEEYRRLLKSDLSGQGPTEEEIAKAERYAHLFFLEMHISLPFYSKTESSSSIEFRVDSFNELKSGNYKVVDRICESIVRGRSFVYPEKCDENRVLKDVKSGVFS
jgi:hypothetical protein